MNVCLSMIDALAEGISSIVSKLDVNILKLETMLKERESKRIGLAFDKGDTIAKEDHASMKAFGNFSSVRGLISTVNNFSGGYVADGLSIKYVYYLSCLYPAVFLIYCGMFFREQKVSLDYQIS